MPRLKPALHLTATGPCDCNGVGATADGGRRTFSTGEVICLLTRCTLMGQLFNTIRQLVAEEKYVVGQHASERLEERGIMEWQAVAGLSSGKLIAERPSATPNPAVEVRECLPDGPGFKRGGSHLPQNQAAK